MRSTAVPRWVGLALLLALVLLAIYRSHLGTRLDSFTVDEPYHIVAGTSYVRTGDFRLNPEHPPLMKLWLGASMPQSFTLRPFQPLHEKVEERDFTEETVFYDNDAEAAQARTRVSLWAFHAVLLFTLGLLIWRAAGLAWAAGVLAYVALEPTLMAHAPVAMTDLPLALSLGIAAAAAALAFTAWRWRWIGLFGLSIGLALGSKHSALPGLLGLATIGCLAAVRAGWRGGARDVFGRLGKLAVAGLIGWVLLWAQYGGRFHASVDGTDPFNSPLSQKVEDLKSGSKSLIVLADKWHLLPRAYLWGLADTVRTGVDGRAIHHLFFGKWSTGRAPMMFWPGLIAAKIPLSLLAMSVLGAWALWRAPLSREMRLLLLCTLAMAGAHLLALAVSKGTWGGIRHALPVVLALAVLGGAAVWRAWNARHRALGIACAGCGVLTFATTIGEARLWEYHNLLAGASEGSYRSFRNEGLDLGQRYNEFKTFYDAVIKPSGKPFYSAYWFIEEQALADKIQYSRFCPTLEDTNKEGVFDGYYLVSTVSFIPVPHEHWDPAIYNGLERVARFGNVVVLRGRWVAPVARAYSLRGHVLEAIYKNPAPNWDLIREKLREVVEALPWNASSAILLGNACLKLDRAAEAIDAYEHALREMKMADPARPDLQRQIARLRAGEPTTAIQPLRSDLLE
ncbi:MAG: phospholipid carrier-dependent glycosyltransferase [Chthoniobacterales bacterium]|nr:phospholipid carrier-dependent glycosyltransferase [Chthoniobacterales bacterium]